MTYYVRFGREWVNIEITEDTDPKKIFTFYVYLYYECYFTKSALTLLRYVPSLFKAAIAPQPQGTLKPLRVHFATFVSNDLSLYLSRLVGYLCCQAMNTY